MPKKLTQKQIVDRFIEVHGDKYDYSNVVYINSHSKIQIRCTICDFTFESVPYSHKDGHGCPRCGNSERYDTESFIKKAHSVHLGIYTYNKTHYSSDNANIVVTCPKHGDFITNAKGHISGRKHGCKVCGIEKNIVNTQDSLTDFIRKSNNTHNFKYDYSKSNYLKSKVPVEIICKAHGSFMMAPVSQIAGQGCNYCGLESRGLKRRSTLSEILCNFESVHGAKYDYSLIEEKHIGSISNKVPIICKYHGVFQQSITDHYHSKSNCPECASYGFKSKLKGYFYILQSGNITKIGITNLNVFERSKDISRSAQKTFDVKIYFCFENGGIANTTETNLLKLLRKYCKSVDESFDGSSECFLDINYNWLVSEVVKEVSINFKKEI